MPDDDFKKLSQITREGCLPTEISFAIAKAGLVLVPINVRLTAPEVAFIVNDAGAAASIVHHDHGPGL